MPLDDVFRIRIAVVPLCGIHPELFARIVCGLEGDLACLPLLTLPVQVSGPAASLLQRNGLFDRDSASRNSATEMDWSEGRKKSRLN